MPRLKDRNRQIPNGLVFYVPQTKWKAARFASFSTIVNSLIAHRKGNPHLTKKYKWATDYDSVANEVDEFNATVCQRMGWTDYITGTGRRQSGPPPFQPSSLPKLLLKLAAGADVLVEWLASGHEAVAQELADARAKVCSTCPLNAKGDWSSFFTVPVTNAIRKALSQREEWKLATPYDGVLKVCEACSCPLPLKVHMPLEKIVGKMPFESLEALHADCWIRHERSSSATK